MLGGQHLESIYRKRFRTPAGTVVESGAGCGRKTATAGAPTRWRKRMKSQLPHRQPSLARLGKHFLGLIAAVAVEKNWFEVVRVLIRLS